MGLESKLTTYLTGGNLISALETVNFGTDPSNGNLLDIIRWVGSQRDDLKSGSSSSTVPLDNLYAFSRQVAAIASANELMRDATFAAKKAELNLLTADLMHYSYTKNGNSDTINPKLIRMCLEEAIGASDFFVKSMGSKYLQSMFLAIDSLKHLFNMTKDLNYARSAFKLYEEVPHEFWQTHPFHSAYMHSSLGRISVIAYTRLTLTKSQKAKWMEKAISMYLKSAELTERTDERHSAHSYLCAADTVYDMHRDGIKTDRKRAAEAVKWYSKFLDYNRLHPEKFDSIATTNSRHNKHYLSRIANSVHQ